MASISKSEWLIPVGLIALSVVPVVAGTARLVELASGGEITPANARFFAAPVPVVLHIVTVTIFCVLGAYQVVQGLRRRNPAWQRVSGRVMLPCGLVAALSGLWMTDFSPWPAFDGQVLY